MKPLLLSLALVVLGAAPALPTIHVKDDAYTPATLAIHTGQTVLFVNDDDDAHTVTAVDFSFDSKGLDTNGS